MNKEQCFTEWWDSVEPKVISLATRICQHADAQDIAQAVAFAAWREFDSFRDLEGFSRWTKKRAYWLSIDRIRFTRRAQKKELLASDISPDVLVVAFSKAIGDPDAGTELAGERIAQVKREMSNLSRSQRQVMQGLLLGLDHKEIASRLKIKPATIRSHLRNARNRLAEILVEIQI